MPTPDDPERPGEADVGPTILALFHRMHRDLRQELGGLDEETLHWVPTEGANSIATIVRHLVGSEAETLRSVAGVGSVRDRDAEFTAARPAMSDVVGLIDAADDLITELAARIDDAHLGAEISLPTLPAECRSGLAWLVGNYGHAREHVGQIQLTKQLSR
jgi:hypothetical protein